MGADVGAPVGNADGVGVLFENNMMAPTIPAMATATKPNIFFWPALNIELELSQQFLYFLPLPHEQASFRLA